MFVTLACFLMLVLPSQLPAEGYVMVEDGELALAVDIGCGDEIRGYLRLVFPSRQANAAAIKQYRGKEIVVYGSRGWCDHAEHIFVRRIELKRAK